jgi:hypothetical protein
VKLRLLDLKNEESYVNRHWLRGPSLDEHEINGITATAVATSLDLDVSKDSKTILNLFIQGYTERELERAEFPIEFIQHAKDEAVLAFLLSGENGMKLREFLMQRCQELSIQVVGTEDDLSLANLILSNGANAKRRLRVVPVPEDQPKDGRKCAMVNCDNRALRGSSFCSLSCAEETMKSMKREVRVKEALVMRQGKESKEEQYQGEASEDGIAALINPFDAGTAAREVFELFRTGGTKEQLAESADRALQQGGIKCVSPSERVRRVITDVRRLGFELVKSKGGVFRLTGRKR